MTPDGPSSVLPYVERKDILGVPRSPRPVGDLTNRTHGIASTYFAGCRCTPCKEARNVQTRVYKKAYQRALHRLRKAHPDEYQNYYTEEATALGVRVGQPGRRKA